MDALTAMRMTRETLEQLHGGCTDSDDGTVEALTVWCPEAIAALDAAIQQAEQAEQAEPVAWINMEKRRLEWAKPPIWDGVPTVARLDRIPLYTAPPTESMDRRAATARPAPTQADLSASGPPDWDYNDRAVMIRRSGGDWEPAKPSEIIWHLLRRAAQITDDDLRAMLPEPEAALSVNDRGEWCEATIDGVLVYTEQQMLDYGRAIVERCGGMK